MKSEHQMNVPTRFKYWMMHLTQNRLVGWGMRQFIRLIVPRRRVGVGVVLLNELGEVLLLKHAFHGRYPWGLPGGWLDGDERPAIGAMRELREETGLSAELGPIIYFDLSVHPPDLNAYYLASRPDGTIQLSYEIIEARWFKRDQLPQPLMPALEKILAAAFATYYQGEIAV